MASVIECLPRKCKTLSQTPVPPSRKEKKKSTMVKIHKEKKVVEFVKKNEMQRTRKLFLF
jgi:hypothetical protein